MTDTGALGAAPAPPAYADIEAAAGRLKGVAVRTPLLSAPTLDALAGARIFVKAEPLQRTGSFKFRGAYNCLSRLSEEQRRRGVICFSSGNHAQGVSAAAQLLGVRATVVMPAQAPHIKVERCRGYGADVVLHDGDRASMVARAEALAAAGGLALVRPFDDPAVIAGQGTVGLELAAQLAERGAHADAVLVPCGGGGLTAGIAIALERDFPGVPIHTVEPAGFDDTARSLAAGERLANAPGAASICDALLVPQPGALTFPVNLRLGARGLVVTDAAVREAMAAAFAHLKIVVEPGGAVALAAVLSDVLDCRGKTVAVIASGGNVEPAVFAEALSSGPGGPRLRGRAG